MKKILTVAQYVYDKHLEVVGNTIREMKLHKLVYFIQREALVRNDEPIFGDAFEAWKFGPVSIDIRHAYGKTPNEFSERKYTIVHQSCEIEVMDFIFGKYYMKDDWQLSDITHFECSWKNARVGIPDGENGNKVMQLEDIKVDAQRIRERRNYLETKKQIPSSGKISKPIPCFTSEVIDQMLSDTEIITFEELT